MPYFFETIQCGRPTKIVPHFSPYDNFHTSQFTQFLIFFWGGGGGGGGGTYWIHYKYILEEL
ncbi:hypothetical protein AtNW77_Chr1g0070181 [Arabidopsis thaliana]